MVGKVTCSTCGKVWFNGEDYANDNVKCGKPSLCPLMASSDRVNGEPLLKTENNKPMNLNNWPFPPREKKLREPKIKVHIGTVPNIYDDTKKTYYVEVPKVIVTTMRWK